MARSSDQLNHWTHAVQENLPALSKPQAVVLAMWSFAAVMARSATLTNVVAFLAALRGAKPNSVRQRLKEWYKEKQAKKGDQRRQIAPSVCFGSLLGWVLRLWEGKRMALAFDATNLGDRYVALAVSVVFRGCAIPVAWRILPADRKGAWEPCWLALIDELAEGLPSEKKEEMTIIALTDRGLYARWLFEKIRSVGWHPFMRINRNGKFRPAGENRWIGTDKIVPEPGRRFRMIGTMFKTKRCRLECTLLACWEAGYERPWLVVTDLPPAECEVEWYGLRAWIEQGFKCIKSSGLQWQKTRLGDAERVERLWLVYAVASLWMLSVGSEIEQGSPEAACPSATVLVGLASPPGTSGRPRQVRLFRLGLMAVLVSLLHGERLPLPRRLVPLPWPRGPDRSEAEYLDPT
jgi:hypothetical protein